MRPPFHTFSFPECERLSADALSIIAFPLSLESGGNDSVGNDSGKTDVAATHNHSVHSGQGKDMRTA